jgi:serine protease
MKILLIAAGLILCSNAHAVALDEGEAVDNLSASTDNTLYYEIAVPSGTSNLSVSISGGSGDADLYLREGAPSTSSTYDCRPYLSGNDESCSVASPVAGTYYINITAYSGFSGVSLVATYDSGDSSSSNVLQNGDSIDSLSGASDSQQYFEIELPSSASDLNISISGGSGDADLYVRYGAQPTSSSYDCRPYKSGNSESCSFAAPQSGVYYIMLSAYSTYSGVTLSASYTVGNSSDDNSGATWSGFETYYADAIGQTGSSLLSALAEAAARKHDRMNYSQVWSALKYTDEDPDNSDNVILFYTGRSQAKTFNASGNNDPDAWNREHCWPKSHGFSSSGDWGYTDIHHLRPADASVNASRSNKDYDDGGSAISEAPGNNTDSDSFEPRDAVKGDVARMMFYMHVRYNGNDNTGTDDLNLVDYTGTSNANLGKLCALLSWHDQDPVNTEEIERHARIVERQGNRNPFVDYPAWANEVFGPYCD